MARVVHISPADKFMPDFIKLLADNFNINDHSFLMIGDCDKYKIEKNNRTFCLKKDLISFIKLVDGIYSAKKIILHGLYNPTIVLMLFFQPWLLKKCYWVIWGGDLYQYKMGSKSRTGKIKEFFRQGVIRNMGFLVTGTPGDYELALKWYKAKGKHVKCFNYPSNLFKRYDVKPKQGSTINIQVGNSADPSNDHFDIFYKLSRYKEQDINVFVPLSYGNMQYAKKVIKTGREIFGDKLMPIVEFMSLDKYIEFLSNIDVAIFAHKRQQAFGNTITLLGLGKKVYLRRESTLWRVFEEYQIKTFDYAFVEESLFDVVELECNREKVMKGFSEESLIDSLSSWVI